MRGGGIDRASDDVDGDRRRAALDGICASKRQALGLTIFPFAIIIFDRSRFARKLGASKTFYKKKREQQWQSKQEDGNAFEGREKGEDRQQKTAEKKLQRENRRTKSSFRVKLPDALGKFPELLGRMAVAWRYPIPPGQAGNADYARI